LLKAKDIRGIEPRFVELLARAPGTKEEKQDFFRAQLKMVIARPNYQTMWDRLVESLGRVGAAEAVLDYVIRSTDNRLGELLTRVIDDVEVDLNAQESSIVRQIFYRNGNLRPIGQRLVEYLEERGWPWGRTSTHEAKPEERMRSLTELEYDVALSFAGEQRAYVERVAENLGGIRYYYDRHEETKMWGKDLASYLDEIFRTKARYCVMFLSKEYVSKSWPTLEGRSAIARAVEERQEYVLPVRFDETEFPGLRPTIKYLDGRKLTPEQLAGHIKAKILDRNVGAPSPAASSGTVLTMGDAERIATDFLGAKKVDWAIEVSSVKKEGDEWVVKGSVTKRETSKRVRTVLSENWTVRIHGREVVDFEFVPGSGFSIV
jgi:hypothetical protein